jgi:PST family polysaccharide transporter
MYLMLVTTTLSVYYLPRLAEIRGAAELKAEIYKVARLMIPLVMLGAAAIFFLRDLIIHTLFTPDFAPMRDLFAWQLMGDVAKIASWICGFVITGRGLVKYYLLSEIYSHLLLIAFTWLFVANFGLQGTPMAYLATYCSHFILMVILVRRELRRMAVSEQA